MAKNTRKGAMRTEAQVYQSIIDIFMEHGWDAVTYGAIASHTGLSRSGIQRVVPSKASMVNAFQGQVLEYVVSQIDQTNEQTIKASWCQALTEHKFANCIRYLLGAVNSQDQGKTKVANAVTKLIALFGEPLVVELVGLSALYLLGVSQTESDKR